MPKKPLLTVAVVVQDQQDVIETTLTSLYELSDLPLELYVIDDASKDGSGEVIQSVLDYYQHEHTFYFDHTRRKGRGFCLNEVLMQCSTSLLWAPTDIHTVDEPQLKANLDRIDGSLKSGVLQQYDLPKGQEEWMALIQQNQWPTDGHFIWNLAKIPVSNRFFNPFLDAYCALELAARLGYPTFSEGNPSWFQPSPMAEPAHTAPELRQEIYFSLLRKTKETGGERDRMIQALQDLSSEISPLTERDYDIELLNEAISMKKEGRFNTALEMIEQVLADHPNHSPAKQIKVKLLEKKRRFVEASELKHEISRTTTEEPQKKSSEQEPEPEVEESASAEAVKPEPEPKQPLPAPTEDHEPSISLIIPTTTYGKGALEHCLMSISEHCNTADLKLIVVDNASLDDTHDYLEELQEKQFLDCRIITNQQNAGFAASVNQALEQVDTAYACVIHNDIEFEEDTLSSLKAFMNDHPQYALLGPATNKTLNPDQASHNIQSSGPGLVEVDYIDSFCLMMCTDADLRMDEAYELAFFEDIDLCFQAQSAGHKVGIAPHTEVVHHFGETTFSLDLDTESKQYWKNVAYFNDKWDIEKFSEEELKALSPFDQLLALDELANPLYPEEEIKREFERLFTDEMKTEIFNTSHEPEVLCRLVHLFMVMDKRDVMRRMEDRLEDIELPASLIYQLVRFYYKRNIYSRCLFYLDQLQPQEESLRADLYRLAIDVENKDFDQAIPMLRHLLDQAPANPTLYKLAGDIHQFNGNEEEAASFRNLAKQINPFRFDREPTDAFGFEL